MKVKNIEEMILEITDEEKRIHDDLRKEEN